MRNIGVCRDEATSQRNTARPRQAADSTGVVREQEEAACDKHEAYLRELCARSWMAGGFLWHQFDYVLLIVALASIIAAAGVGTFYVQNRLVRRLTSISNALRLLASGDVDTPLPAIATGDEMGEMSRALQVLHAGEIERRKLVERERGEQMAQRARASSIDGIIEDFRATVTAIVTTLTGRAAAMETTARGLSAIASEADDQARAVAYSSDATSKNVHTVAEATEELGVFDP